MLKFFVLPILALVFGLAGIGLLTWSRTPDIGLVSKSLLTVFLLSILEISISFDNAVVNATVLRKMSEVWKKRFLTWGMLVAVFGMRFFFPLLIVSITGGFSLMQSLQMATTQPEEYSRMMLASHLSVSSFGGAFLLMVFLHFFINEEKKIHWITFLESPIQKVSSFNSAELVIAILTLLGIHQFLPVEMASTFLVSSLWGLVVFLLTHGVSDLLGSPAMAKIKWLSSGLGLFMYLEVLDASFSFDGVVGAFALSTHLFVIMVGLSVGAFFVRGLTLYLVEKETLNQYAFLEHGAFYALGALAFFMLFDPFFHFSEWITALTGAAILVLSILWSIHIDRKERAR
jgi:uncharacterized protein